MKNLTIVFATLFITSLGFAQLDSDTTKLTIKGKKVIIVDDDSTSVKSKKKKSKKVGNVKHYEGFYMGISGLRNNKNSLNLGPSQMELEYSRSFNFQLNMLEKSVPIIKEYVKLSTGVGLDFHSFRIGNNLDLFKGADGIVENINSNLNYKKNDLNVAYIKVPVILGFSTTQQNDKGLKIAVGGQVGYRISGNIRKKYTLGGETFKLKENSDIYLSSFSYSALARITFDNICFYGTYDFSTLFDSGKAVEMYPFSIGIRLAGF
jgi:lipopolysaccharide assembly outer membrane protein LptD (OstA)